MAYIKYHSIIYGIEALTEITGVSAVGTTYVNKIKIVQDRGNFFQVLKINSSYLYLG